MHEQILPLFYPEGLVYEALVEMYTEERFELSADEKELTIYFPIINISNELGEKHIIQEMYVKFAYEYSNSNNTKGSLSLYGLRTHATLQEIIQTYCHSHCDGNIGKWAPFCLGSVMTILINNWQSDPSQEKFLIILFTLDSFLSSESIEGGPYKRIYGNYLLPNITSYFRSINEDEIKNANDNSFKFIIENEKIIPDDINKEIAEQSFPARYYLDHYSPELQQNIHKKYFDCEEEAFKQLGSNFFNKNRYFTFKGKRIWCDIINTPTIEVIEDGSKILSEACVPLLVSSCAHIINSQLSTEFTARIISAQNSITVI